MNGLIAAEDGQEARFSQSAESLKVHGRMVFISWTKHNRRSQLIAEKLGMRLHLVHALKRRPWLAPVRYVLQWRQTWQILTREKPCVVFVQNPPIFAVLAAYLYTVMSKAQFVIDSHSAALLGATWGWSLPLHAFLSRRAVVTIVTNDHLQGLVAGWGGRTFIVADIPTVFPPGKLFPIHGQFSVAVINTFAPDEPVEAILAAARSLPRVHFYVTGDPLRARAAWLRDCPANMSFTGFLPDDDYIGLLRSVQAIMVLTTRDHTMQRGACEAVSLGKPIITSDWPLLRQYFHLGTIHVDNSVDGIRGGVQRMEAEQQRLEREVLELQTERRLEWVEKEAALRRLLADGLS